MIHFCSVENISAESANNEPFHTKLTLPKNTAPLGRFFQPGEPSRQR